MLQYIFLLLLLMFLFVWMYIFLKGPKEDSGKTLTLGTKLWESFGVTLLLFIAVPYKLFTGRGILEYK